MRLDAVNQESAEAFLESNKTAEQRDAEYVQRQLKRGIIIGKDGSIRRASDARLEDREQETDPANTDLEATDLAPSKEGDES